METFFFEPEIMGRLYDCSMRTDEEWAAFAKPNILIGLLYSGAGAIYFVTYLPFVIVMFKTDITKYSCYKIMLFLGCIDVICIPISGFICGWCAFKGLIFCLSPKLLYISGAFGVACWGGCTSTVLVLGLNRCIELANRQLSNKLFAGRKTYYWLLFPTTTFIYFACFHTTVVFSSHAYAVFFDPYAGLPERAGQVDSVNYPHTVHSTYNLVFVTTLLLEYICLFIILFVKTRSSNTQKMNKLQRQTFTQSIIICTAMFTAGLIYVYTQFFPAPQFIAIVGQFAWLSSHGCVGIVYAFFNPTLRKRVLELLCLKKSAISTMNVVEPIGSQGNKDI